MQYRGAIAIWNDDKGFGFIRPAGGGAELFFHVSDYNGAGRPAGGDLVLFTIGTGRDGRPAAFAVGPAFSRATPNPAPASYFEANSIRVWLAACVIALAFAVAIIDRAPILLTLIYLAMGGISYGFYLHDKRAAQTGKSRIRETWLHFIDTSFGIVGGLLAQQTLRHKTSKRSFAGVSFTIAGLHATLLVSLLLDAMPAI